MWQLKVVNHEHIVTILLSLCFVLPEKTRSLLSFSIVEKVSVYDFLYFGAFQVLEACMNNCGKRFHSEAAKFRFLNELIKVLTPKVRPVTETELSF